MTVDRISYQKVFPLGMYINERIGVEMQLDKGDSPDEALAKAKEMVEGFHNSTMSQYNSGFLATTHPSDTIGQLPTKKVESKEVEIGLRIEDIFSCRDLKILESYRFLVRNNPDLLDAYHKKNRELQLLNDSK